MEPSNPGFKVKYSSTTVSSLVRVIKNVFRGKGVNMNLRTNVREGSAALNLQQSKIIRATTSPNKPILQQPLEDRKPKVSMNLYKYLQRYHEATPFKGPSGKNPAI